VWISKSVKTPHHCLETPCMCDGSSAVRGHLFRYDVIAV
jgi:hypothetical protein